MCNLLGRIQSYSSNNAKVVRTMPTVGLQLLELKKKNVNWRIWDMSGQGRYRMLWKYYCPHVQAIIFVVDLEDIDRVAVAKDELYAILNHKAVKERRLPILVYANKSDVREEEEPEEDRMGDTIRSVDTDDATLLAGDELGGGLANLGSRPRREMTGLDPTMVHFALNIEGIEARHPTLLVESSGLTGKGVDEGFVWLTNNVR